MTNFFYHYSWSWQSLLQVWTLFVKVTIDWQWGRSREKLVKLWLEIILIQVDTFRRWLNQGGKDWGWCRCWRRGTRGEVIISMRLVAWCGGLRNSFSSMIPSPPSSSSSSSPWYSGSENCTWHDWAAIIRMIRENIWLTNNEQCLISVWPAPLIRSVSHVYEGARSFLWSGHYNWNSFNGVIWTDISDWNLGR